jgi:thioredoxin reductase (NADPH)
MRRQAEKFGTEVVDRQVTAVEFDGRPFKVIADGKTRYLGKSVIIATGAEFNWLGLPSEQKLIGRGVSSCATCDAAFFKDKKVMVVGGGDAAMEEALVLVKYASEVTVVHRREAFRASKIMQDRVLNHPKIKVKWNTIVKEIIGDEKVEGVLLSTPHQLPPNLGGSAEGGSGEKMDIDGVFVAIGHSPATKIFKEEIDLDERGYIKKVKKGEMLNEKGGLIGYKYNMATSVEGVFVAGDVHDHHYRQAVTAAGYGCEAALETEKWLEEN